MPLTNSSEGSDTNPAYESLAMYENGNGDDKVWRRQSWSRLWKQGCSSLRDARMYGVNKGVGLKGDFSLSGLNILQKYKGVVF